MSEEPLPVPSARRICGLSDGALAQELSGDPVAFGALIREIDPYLRRVVWAVVGNGPDTDDVMQDSYEKAFLAISTFEGRSSIRTWLHSICYRTALDFVRHSSRRRHDGEGVLQTLPSSEFVDEQVSSRDELATMFALLRQDERAVLMLRGLGYSTTEIAKITGLRFGTVASKGHRAQKKLRRARSALSEDVGQHRTSAEWEIGSAQL